MYIDNIDCIGFDPSGYPVYTFNLNVTPNNYMYSNFFAYFGTLSGMPSAIGPGLTVINGAFIDATPNDGFCIYLYAYDFTTHDLCFKKVCVDHPPSDCDSRIIAPPVRSDNSYIVTASIPELSLVPNPATNMVYLRYVINSGGTIRISDTRGKLLFTQKSNDYKGTVNIYTAQWLLGIYFVSVTGDSGECLVKKLVLIK